jgi:plastocyanin
MEQEMMIYSRLTLSFFAASLALSSAACGKAQGTAEVPVVTPPAISVSITESNCPNMQVQIGMQVAWTNQGGQVRVVRARQQADGSRAFDSGQLQPGDSFRFTFMEPGVFEYECSEDGTRTGMVSVGP